MKLLKSVPLRALSVITGKAFKKTLNLLATVIIFAVLAAPTNVRAAEILYAKPSPTGTGNCSSWANACALRTAIEDSQSGDQIWVMAGIHKPTTTSNRAIAFVLKDGVAIYGGFAGTETLLSQRNPAANVAILSGDLDDNDTDIPFQNYENNSYNVVYSFNVTSATILDGVTIQGGNAEDFTEFVQSRGGGMYNWNGSPTLNNVRFRWNFAFNGGAGKYNEFGNPSLTNVTFENNLSIAAGGGMFNDFGNPSLTNVVFLGNYGSTGGGIYNSGSNPILNRVTLTLNESNTAGGGMYNTASIPTLTNVTFSGNKVTNGDGGGMYNSSNSNSLLVNVTFLGNAANGLGQGGGIYNIDSNPSLTNVILWGNSAAGGGPDIMNISSAPGVGHSIVQGSGGSVSWNAAFGVDNGNNLDTDPMLGALANNGGYMQTHALALGSAAIDTGSNLDCPSADARGVVRPQGAACDIGAYEKLDGTSFPTFADVPLNGFGWAYIESVYFAGITGGCTTSPLHYCPNNPVTRSQMAIFLLRGKHGSSFSPPAPVGNVFNDVPAHAFAAAWIEQLASEGITGGCGGGSYCPNNTVTRSQMAIFLLRAKYGSSYTPPPATGGQFLDVSSGAFAAAWIEQLVAEGITGGCGGGNYCPNNPVTRSQMAIFLQRTFNLPLP